MRGCETHQLFREGYLLKLEIMYGGIRAADEERRSKVKMTFHSVKLKS